MTLVQKSTVAFPLKYLLILQHEIYYFQQTDLFLFAQSRCNLALILQNLFEEIELFEWFAKPLNHQKWSIWYFLKRTFQGGDAYNIVYGILRDISTFFKTLLKWSLITCYMVMLASDTKTQ